MSWFFQMAVLAVLFSLLYILIPDGEMKRISGMVLAIIFILRMLSPLISLGNNKFSSWLLSWEINAGISGEENPALIHEILTDYEAKCIHAISDYVNKQEGVSSSRIQVTMDKDTSSDTFGHLQHIYVYVSFGQESQGSSLESWIKPIEILPESWGESKVDHSEECNDLAVALSEWLELDGSCVTVFEEDI